MLLKVSDFGLSGIFGILKVWMVKEAEVPRVFPENLKLWSYWCLGILKGKKMRSRGLGIEENSVSGRYFVHEFNYR